MILVLGIACHCMVWCLPLVQRRKALFSTRLVFHHKVGLSWVQLVPIIDWRCVFSYFASGICHAHCITSCTLYSSCTMMLFTTQVLSMFDVVRLFTSLIGKMISSIIVSCVQKASTIPNSFMVLQPTMRSNTGLVIFFSLYSTASGITRYSLLFECSNALSFC